VFFVLAVTLSLFPGFTCEFRNYDSEMPRDDFVEILIMIYQTCDFIGRTLPKWFRFPPKKYLWIAVISRVIFYPLFMLLIYTNIFFSEKNLVAYFVLIIFGLTSGYFASVGMVYGPSELDVPEQKNGGLLMGFFIQFGVFCGVHLAIILLAIVGIAQF